LRDLGPTCLGARRVRASDTGVDDGHGHALGLLPLALSAGEPGKEIEGPMAVIILGGLVTSTVLNLLVLPTVAVRYGRFEASCQSV